MSSISLEKNIQSDTYIRCPISQRSYVKLLFISRTIGKTKIIIRIPCFNLQLTSKIWKWKYLLERLVSRVCPLPSSFLLPATAATKSLLNVLCHLVCRNYSLPVGFLLDLFLELPFPHLPFNFSVVSLSVVVVHNLVLVCECALCSLSARG